ncbi:hypothetical protein Q8F55_008523 [Vanrija albida]|uniref:Major facilitator superfamily (MFS) profile domain-containing protein n=1 Tax=Vanrija albida TaxID=181172 RepID=A0ABR3PRF1_9TREE
MTKTQVEARSSSFELRPLPAESPAPTTAPPTPAGDSTDALPITARELPPLPPVDRGVGAWSFLVAGTVVETITWGLPYSVGVLHAYWAHEMFPGDEGTITLAATLQNGMLFSGSLLFGPILAAFPHHVKMIQVAGLLVSMLGLITSAFVTKAWHLVITLGILYPCAGALYLPCVSIIYEWFQARRGLANGIMFSGAAAGGTFFPLLGGALLHRFGHKGTMLTLGAIFGVGNGVALLFVKRRIPVARVARGAHRPRIDYSFFKHRSIWAMSGFVVLTAMGNFIPSLWMPTFAQVVGTKKIAGTDLVALMYAASVAGNLATGWLSDRYPAGWVVFGSCVLASVATWTLWGWGASDALLIMFCLVWGLTALSTASAWSRMISYISKDDLTLPGLLFALQTGLRGGGNFASGPLSTALLKTSVLQGAAGVYGSTNYGVLLLYTGAVTFVGGLIAAMFPVTSRRVSTTPTALAPLDTAKLDTPEADLAALAIAPYDPASLAPDGTDPESPAPEVTTFALPPVDGGRQAWLFLAGATTCEMIVWGLPYSVGVLHAFWVAEMFPGEESTVTLAATLMNGLLMVGAGFLGPILAAFAPYTKYIQIFGLVCGTLGLVSTAFVTQAWHLIITLGLLYPLCGALYLPCATILYEWFHARRGLATGIMYSGAAAGGTFFPLLGHALLKGVGYKATMITLGAIFGVANGVAIIFVRRRVPLPKRAPGVRARVFPKLDYGFLRRRAVWAMCGWVLVTAMANFLPTLWIPTFAEVVGPTHPSGTSLVALMYGASIAGNLLTGHLSDRFQVRWVVLGSCAFAAVSACALWGMGTKDALLVAFAVVWGLTALASASAWSQMIIYISKDDMTLPGLLFSILTMLRGAGNFASGPISTALLKSGAVDGAKGAYATNYGSMMLYTGIVTFAGGLTALIFPST